MEEKESARPGSPSHKPLSRLTSAQGLSTSLLESTPAPSTLAIIHGNKHIMNNGQSIDLANLSLPPGWVSRIRKPKLQHLTVCSPSMCAQPAMYLPSLLPPFPLAPLSRSTITKGQNVRVPGTKLENRRKKERIAAIVQSSPRDGSNSVKKRTCKNKLDPANRGSKPLGNPWTTLSTKKKQKKAPQTKLLHKSSSSKIKSVLNETKNNDVHAMLFLARMLRAALK